MKQIEIQLPVQVSTNYELVISFRSRFHQFIQYIYHSLSDILVCTKTIHYYSTILLLSLFYRIAVNNLNFVSNILGIKNLVHKQKLANKATDVVLFGPPKCELITSIIVMHIFHHHMTCKPWIQGQRLLPLQLPNLFTY